jgi:hypothetical protein
MAGAAAGAILRADLALRDDRLWFLPGGTYFFTLVTERRRTGFCNPLARRSLREARVRRQRPSLGHRLPILRRRGSESEKR